MDTLRKDAAFLDALESIPMYYPLSQLASSLGRASKVFSPALPRPPASQRDRQAALDACSLRLDRLSAGSSVTDTIDDNSVDIAEGSSEVASEAEQSDDSLGETSVVPPAEGSERKLQGQERRRLTKRQSSALTKVVRGLPRPLQNNLIFKLAKRLGRALDSQDSPRSPAPGVKEGSPGRSFGISGAAGNGFTSGGPQAAVQRAVSKALDFSRRFLTDETADLVAEIRRLDPAFSLSRFVEREAQGKILKVLSAYFSNGPMDLALLERELTPRALASLLTTLKTRLESELNVTFVPYYIRSPTISRVDAEKREISLVYVLSAIYMLYDDVGDVVLGSELGRDFQVEAKLAWRGSGAGGWVIDELNLNILNPRIRPSFV